MAAGQIPDVGDAPFWLVDPLDGTKEFISGNGEFTVNIGLIEHRVPVLGVVLAPARGLAWWGAAGHGAHRRENDTVSPIQARRRPATGAVAVASRSHRDAATDAWLQAEGIEDTVSAGSSLKFCLVAEGKADVYPRFGPTMEWDTAAGDAVLRAAGGRVSPPTATRSSTSSRASATRASSPSALERRRPGGGAADPGLAAPAASAAGRDGASAGGAAPARGSGPGPARPAPPAHQAGRPRARAPAGPGRRLRQERRGLWSLLRQGFAWVEVGTVTPLAQAGNPRPRLFRLAPTVRSSTGWASTTRVPRPWRTGWPAATAARHRRRQYRDEQGRGRPAGRLRAGPAHLAPLADYITVNVSSPNTPGLRALQKRAALERLLAGLDPVRGTVPLLLKIAPDIAAEDEADIAELCVAHRLAALIVGNTTLERPPGFRSPLAAEAGGLSGRPLFERSTRLLARLAVRLAGRVPLVGVGGIATGADAYAKLRAGATALQLYTAMVYQGPGIVARHPGRTRRLPGPRWLRPRGRRRRQGRGRTCGCRRVLNDPARWAFHRPTELAAATLTLGRKR